MDTPQILTVIGFGISLIVAIYSSLIARKNTKDVEKLKAKISEELAEKNARRDYEYDAKRKLYQNYEPLFFQLTELCEVARSRVEGIAKNAKENKLENPEWIKLDNYYFISTFYYTFSPLAIFKLMQKNLTLIDLSIDDKIHFQYNLIRMLYFSLQDDFKISRIADFEFGKKYFEEWGKDHSIVIENFERQGLNIGKLDMLINTLIEKNDDKYSLLPLYELEKKITDEKFRNELETLLRLFNKFTPNNKPILWTILIVQSCIFNIILQMKQFDKIDKIFLINQVNHFFNNTSEYEWNTEKDKMQQIFSTAKKHLVKQINKKFK